MKPKPTMYELSKAATPPVIREVDRRSDYMRGVADLIDRGLYNQSEHLVRFDAGRKIQARLWWPTDYSLRPKLPVAKVVRLEVRRGAR